MVSNEFDEALGALRSAIKANDPGEVEGSLITLDLEDGMSRAPSDRLFEGMLEAAEYVSAHGTCAWQIFFWFQRRYFSMSDEQKRRTRDYIATCYGRIVDDSATLEVAEWVGRFRDEWALGVIEGWIAERSTFRSRNAADISAALSQFLDNSYGPMDGEVRKRGLELSRAYQAALESK